MESFIDKHGKKRVARLVFCLLAVLLIAEGIIVYLDYTAISYGDATLRLVNVSAAGVTMKDAAGEALFAAFAKPDYAPRVTDFSFSCTVTYCGKKIYRAVGMTRGLDSTYIFSDGSELDLSYGLVMINGEPDYGAPLTLLQTSEMALVERVCGYYFNPKGVGFIVLVALAGVVLLLLGVRSFFYPENVWRWRHMFSVSGGEPTELYITVTKALGVLWAAFAFALVFFV